jgi:hypothetical protein
VKKTTFPAAGGIVIHDGNSIPGIPLEHEADECFVFDEQKIYFIKSFFASFF